MCKLRESVYFIVCDKHKDYHIKRGIVHNPADEMNNVIIVAENAEYQTKAYTVHPSFIFTSLNKAQGFLTDQIRKKEQKISKRICTLNDQLKDLNEKRIGINRLKAADL